MIGPKTLYMKDSKGAIREWTISGILEDPFAHIELEYGVLGGEMIYHDEEISENLSGRTLEQQLLLQFNSRVNKMKDKGYVESINEAKKGRTNALNMPKPMLAQRFDKIKDIDYKNAYVQRKYDGNRCLIANVNGQIIAYTRNGKPIRTIDHITMGISIPESTILDGELYAHGESLQTIVSWIKREQPETKKLKYHAYDLIHPLPFAERFSKLSELDLGVGVRVAPTEPVASPAGALEALREYREEGYEGAILRWGKWGYEDGKRSKSLVKMKKWLDNEFKVIRVEISKDGWGILVMQNQQGKEFRASAPGSIQDKILVATNPNSYIERFVTIEYAYLTADGIPFHPIAKCWYQS